MEAGSTTGTTAPPDEGGASSPDQLCACLERLYERITAPKEPTLYRAELFTLTGDTFAKEEEVGIYVAVKTADDRTLVAFTTNADSGYGFYYDLTSAHTLPLVVQSTGITKADCLGFKVTMWINLTPGPHNPWQVFLGRVTLMFTDGTALVAEKWDFQLYGERATATFVSP